MTTQRAVASDLTGTVRSNEQVPPLGPTIAIPLRAFGGALGALLVARAPGGALFSAAELDMAAEFGRQTSVALAVARSRADRIALQRAEERNRIARDLHDHVVQRLFGTGLALQAIARDGPARFRERLDEQVGNIDAAIQEIRTAIFALDADHRRGRDSVRERILTTIASVAPALTVRPHITFSGAIDLRVQDDLVDDLVAVVRETMTNVGRHAPGAACRVQVRVDADTLRVVIADDGPGPFPGVRSRSSGLTNLAVRAERRGGTCSVSRGERGGTEVRWTVPLPDESGAR